MSPSQERTAATLDDFRVPWDQGSGPPTISVSGGEMTVTTPTGSTGAAFRDLAFDMSHRYITADLTVDDDLYTLSVHLITGGRDFANRFSAIYSALPRGERFTLSLCPADFTAHGTATDAGFDDIRQVFFSLSPKAGTTPSVVMHSLKLHHMTHSPGVVWCFDDARADTYTFAYPLMEAYGIKGVVPVITNLVGGSTLSDGIATMNVDQLDSLAAEGWELVSHTHNNVRMDTADASTRKSEMLNSYDWLADRGYVRDGTHLVFVGGRFDSDTVADAERFYRSARTTNDKGGIAPTDDRYRLGTRYVQSGWTLDQAKQSLDRVSGRGGVTVLTFHSFFDAPAQSYNWHRNRFSSLVEHAASLGLRSYNFSDLY